MGPLRRRAVPFVLLLAAACGTTGPAPDRVLSATGTASPEAPATVPTTTATTAAAPTTTKPVLTSTSTTVRRAATTVARSAPTRAPAPSTPPIAGYSPAPPPPGVVADGYGGYGGVTDTTVGGSTVTLWVYPREQYLGETMQVAAEVTGKDAIRSLTIDFGNGYVLTSPRQYSWDCATEDRKAGDSKWYVYPAPGQYRITATAVVVPCGIHPGPPAGTIGPDGQPLSTDPMPLSPIGTPHTVSAGMDVLQRPDRHLPPVGPSPGP